MTSPVHLSGLPEARLRGFLTELRRIAALDDPAALAALDTFAWSSPVGDTHNRRFFAVLKLGPVQSARDAVKASILQTYREETKDAH